MAETPAPPGQVIEWIDALAAQCERVGEPLGAKQRELIYLLLFIMAKKQIELLYAARPSGLKSDAEEPVFNAGVMFGWGQGIGVGAKVVAWDEAPIDCIEILEEQLRTCLLALKAGRPYLHEPLLLEDYLRAIDDAERVLTHSPVDGRMQALERALRPLALLYTPGMAERPDDRIVERVEHAGGRVDITVGDLRLACQLLGLPS